MSNENKYNDELFATAKAIGAKGKGILAADESTGTIGKRLAGIKQENTLKNRTDYRKLLFTTKGLNEHISGVILYEETLYQKDDQGKLLVDNLTEQGIILGIKVDLGVRKLAFANQQGFTQGLDNLGVRCAKYYEAGCRFAKWRAVLSINTKNGSPSEYAIRENAWTLARYASICQENGLCPIVEPEILMDGDHDIETAQKVHTKVLSACYKALVDMNVYLKGTMLKPSMVLPGKECKTQATPEQCAKATVESLQDTVPVSVPAVVFLSGGQTEKEATANLNAINSGKYGTTPWSLTFSFGRALQQSCLKAWQGKPENLKNGQGALLDRARHNGLAQQGKYDATKDDGSGESLYVKNYTY